MKKSVTLKDIATNVGVSAVTVSKALTNKDGVSDEVRQEIKRVARELGYKYGSQEGENVQSGIIGVIGSKRFMNEDCNTFYLKIYQSLVQALSRHNFYAILEIISCDDEDELIAPKLLNNKKVDALIVLGQFHSKYVEMLLGYTSKIVLMDYYDKNTSVDSIISDSVYGSYRAANYLIKQGHKKIGFVGNKFATNSIMDRYLGYYKAMLENGFDIKPEWVVDDRDLDNKYVELNLPDRENMPTAFISSCDQVCYLLIDKLKKLGYCVPDDISVVGYDNFIYADISPLKLTTVDVNIEAMTESAADLIIKKVRGQGHYGGVRIVESKLITRDSVKPLI